MYRNSKNKEMLNEAMKLSREAGKPFIVLDFETTGLSAENDRPIEVALSKAVLNENNQLVEVEKMIKYINPGIPIPAKITSITHITDAMVKDSPGEDQIMKDIASFCGEAPILVGHNIPFDLKFLYAMVVRTGVVVKPLLTLDTLSMARDLLTKGGKLKSHKLGDIAEYFDIKGDEIRLHDAGYDIFCTLEILNRLIKLYENSEMPETGTEKAVLKKMTWWFKRVGRNNLTRIYVSTDHGDLYYDVSKRGWFDKDEGITTTVDVDDLASKCQTAISAVDEEDWISKMKERKRFSVSA